MSKLCALVIGHKKKSPGAVNANANLNEFDFNDDLALRIEKKIQKAEIQGSKIEGSGSTFDISQNFSDYPAYMQGCFVILFVEHCFWPGCLEK